MPRPEQPFPISNRSQVNRGAALHAASACCLLLAAFRKKKRRRKAALVGYSSQIELVATGAARATAQPALYRSSLGVLIRLYRHLLVLPKNR